MLATVPPGVLGASSCETKSRFSRDVPACPKVIDWISESNVSITWARASALNSTTWVASGQVAHETYESNARLETRRFWSRLNWVKVSVVGSKISTPLAVET